MRNSLLLPALVIAAATAACSGSGGERTLPASPVAPGELNSANLTAPAPDAPGDNQQVDGLRPTLTVTNATSSGGSGSRSYEFQIADNSGFAMTAASRSAVTISLSGVPEGANGKTSFTPPADLLPATRYYWRARALQGGSIGPWSSTAHFWTRVASFKSGNRAFDILTTGVTVADETRSVSLLGEGAKLDSSDAYLMYRLTQLPEGEVSFVGYRVKPDQSGRIITIQDGTGDFNSNPFRVNVEKRSSREGGKIVFQFAGGNPVETGGIGWADRTDYFFKLEWRGGTARLRVFHGSNEGGGAFVDVSTTYSAPYGASAPVVAIGSRGGGTCADIRVRNLFIGLGDRPSALSSSPGQ